MIFDSLNDSIGSIDDYFTINDLRQKNEELEESVEFYKKSMDRVAHALGVIHPCMLMVLCESSEETYTDGLIKYIEKYITKPE